MRRAAVALAALARVATADIAATTHGSTLELTITNRSAAPLEVASVATAGIALYPELEVSLGKRTLHFTEDTEMVRREPTVIAPGKSHTLAIDLERYAPIFDNGGPIAPGDYKLSITWARLGAATTTLHIPAPLPKRCSAAADPDLEVYAQRDGDVLTIVVHNAGTEAQCIATARVVLALDNIRKLPLRVKAQTVELPPGASWAVQRRFHVPAGVHELRAKYGALQSHGILLGAH